MIKSLLMVGAGSFVGGALRYALSLLMRSHIGGSFPWSTLAVNLIGCFLFGVLFALFNRIGSPGSSWCLFLTTGLCGGFTTFSTFANESMQMLRDNNMMGFAGYVAASVILGVSLVAFGYWIAK